MEQRVETFRCVVQSITGPAVVLRGRSTSYTVSFTAIHQSDSGPLTAADQLHPGDTVEVQTVNSQFCRGTVQAADLWADYWQQVQLYSPAISPVSLLAEAYGDSPVLAIVGTRCVACRKLSTGDGVSLWTVLAVCYMDWLAQKSTPVGRLTDLERAIAAGNGTEKSAMVGETVGRLRKMRENAGNEGNGASWMVAKCVAEDFWTQLGLILKQECTDLTQNYRKIHDLSDFQVCLKAFVTVFRVKMVVFQPIEHNYKEKYSPETDFSVFEQCIYLFSDSNRFHILYSEAQIADFDLNPVTFRRKTPEIDAKTTDFYQIQREISVFIEFLRRVQVYISVFFELLDEKRFSQLSNDSFSSDFTEFIVELNRFHRELTQSRSIPFTRCPEFDQFLPPILSKAISLGLLCPFCRTNPASIRLLCDHKPCSPCLQAYIAGQLATSPVSLLSPSGQPTSAFKCLSPDCYLPIPPAVFSSITPPDLIKAAISRFAQETDLVTCAVCSKSYESAVIPAVCNCDFIVCVPCYSDLFREHPHQCVCGAVLDTATYTAFAGYYSAVCPLCGEQKLLVSGFTAIRCSAHRLCETCLDATFTVNITKCPLCFRAFTIEEIKIYRQNRANSL